MSNSKKRSKWKLIFDAYLGVEYCIEILIGFSLFFIFRRPIELFIGATLVEYVFQNIQSDVWADVSWFLLCILVLIGFLFSEKLKLKTPRTSLRVAITLLCISFIYWFLYRFGDVWIIKNLDVIHQLKYPDILVWYTSLNTISWVIFLKNIPIKEKENQGFYEDLPLGDDKTLIDLLGFGPYANSVAQMIIRTFPKKSFVIGINAEWGSGKTSFMHLIDEEVSQKDSKITQLKFNPWESSDPKFIIRDFFEELETNIGAENRSLVKKVSAYSNKLTHLDKSSLSKAINIFTKPREVSASSLRSEVSKILELSGKRIVVYIDDLDRLDSEELVQVFKLIRNSANFKNVFFLLAYDRSYIDTAVSKRTEYQERKYLEKIVQTEINLPRASPQILRDELFKNIEEIVQSSKVSESAGKMTLGGIEEVIRHGDILESIGSYNPLNDYLTSFRDVRRISNSLKVNMPNLIDEVFVPDFFRLELLKLRHPKVYRSLQINPNELLSNSKNTDERRFIFKGEEEVIANTLKKWGYAQEDVPNISKFLSEIFPDNTSSLKKDSAKLSVQIFRNYHLYFRYYLDDQDFSETEYRKYKEAGISKFKEQIITWVEKGKESRIRERLGIESVFQITNLEEFKTILEGSLYLASLKSKEYEGHKIGFYRPNCQHWCLDSGNQISSTFYEGDKGELKSYIEKLLKSELEDGYLTISSFVDKLKEIVSQLLPQEDFIFNLAELAQINIYHLEQTLKSANSYNNQVTSLLLQTRDLSNSVSPWWKQIPHNASAMVWKFIEEKSLQDQLLFSLISRALGQNNYRYSLHEHYLLFFESKNEFINYNWNTFSASGERQKIIQL